MTMQSNQSTSPKLSRRFFLRTLLALGASASALTAFSYRGDTPQFVIDEITLAIPGLSSHLDGHRLAQLSDLHLSRRTGPEQFALAVASLAAYDVEWLVLTGDYVGGEAEYAAGLVAPLAALDIPVLAVLGNHDYGTHLPTVSRFLQEAGAIVLVNDAIELGGNLWVAGLDNVWSGRPNLRAALQAVPSHATTLLLVHEPDIFDTILREDAPVAVQLSGHSHGGQIRLPTAHPDEEGRRTYAPVLPPLGERYPIGLRTIDGRSVYTNRGLGGWPISLRLNCQPELTIFTLRSA